MMGSLARTLRPVDRVVAGYQLLMVFSCLVLRKNISGWELVAVRHAVALSVVLGLGWWVNKSGGRLARLAYDWYPVVTLPLAYRWAGDFVHALFPWTLDGYLYCIDAWLLGTTPASLLNHISAPWFADLMQLSYCSFFLLIATSSLLLYLTGRRVEFQQISLAIILALYSTYLLFMFLPAHSPRFEYPLSVQGGKISMVIGDWLNRVAFRGGAFPSGHAAATFSICVLMWRAFRWHFWPFLILSFLLLLSTLYGGYHYLIDMLAGLILGAVATSWAVNYGGHEKLNNRW